jgi:predicted nucleic acid-binding protein
VIVVDASAAVLGLLRDGTARSLLGTETVAAPFLIDVEIANALRNRVHRGHVDAGTARQALHVWESLVIAYHPGTELLDRIWQLRDNLSAYDALYVAVAESLECGLLSADERLARAPGPSCPIEVATT